MPQSTHGSRSILALSLILSMSCGEQVVVRETRAACGNELIEVDEQCDDGNQNPADGCTDGCKIAVCGDAIPRTDLEPGEEALSMRRRQHQRRGRLRRRLRLASAATACCGSTSESARSALKPVMTATRKMMTAAAPTARWRSAVTASCAPT